MPERLGGKYVLITSGPTRADLDAVRYVSNRSSGRLGCAIAVEALRRGARVTLVAGPDSAVPRHEDLTEDEHGRLGVLPVVTVPDVLAALEGALTGGDPPDAIVHAMAVLDYVPESAPGGKMPSGRAAWQIRLVRTPKVIKEIRRWAPGALLVQFKLEVGLSEAKLREAAVQSVRANRADLVLANDLTQIRDETHPALVISADGEVLARPGTKGEIARTLCDLLAERL